MEKFVCSIALDWSPNGIQSPVLLAYYKGYYLANNIECTLVSPESSNYWHTVGQIIESGTCDIGIGPTEMAIESNATDKSEPLVQFASLFQNDLSVFATVNKPEVQNIKDISGKCYAALLLPYEPYILGQLTRYDQEKETIMITPPRLEVWEMVLTQKADLAWVFSAWELIEARLNGYSTQSFSLEEMGIPYGYGPGFLTRKSMIRKHPNLFYQFLDATQKAAREIAQDPISATKFLCSFVEHKNFSNPILVEESIKAIVPHLFDENGHFGTMRRQKLKSYLGWLQTQSTLHYADENSEGLCRLRYEDFTWEPTLRY